MTDKRGLATRIPISNSIDKELYKRLKEYSQQTDIPLSKLLDRSIKMFLDSLNGK